MQYEDLNFCDADSMPDSPFPICSRHALNLFRRMAKALDEADPVYGFENVKPVQFAPEDKKLARNYRSKTAARERREIVYYLLVDGLVKIGYSSNFKNRLKGYPPHAHILGTEQGGRDLERVRLRQFEHLRASRYEWFHPGAELRAHIETLTDYRSAG